MEIITRYYKSVYRLLVLDRNTWNHTNEYLIYISKGKKSTYKSKYSMNMILWDFGIK